MRPPPSPRWIHIKCSASSVVFVYYTVLAMETECIQLDLIEWGREGGNKELNYHAMYGRNDKRTETGWEYEDELMKYDTKNDHKELQRQCTVQRTKVHAETRHFQEIRIHYYSLFSIHTDHRSCLCTKVTSSEISVKVPFCCCFFLSPKITINCLSVRAICFCSCFFDEGNKDLCLWTRNIPFTLVYMYWKGKAFSRSPFESKLKDLY